MTHPPLSPKPNQNLGNKTNPWRAFKKYLLGIDHIEQSSRIQSMAKLTMDLKMQSTNILSQQLIQPLLIEYLFGEQGVSML